MELEEDIEEEALQVPKVLGRHIKKRALKNKALSVSFDEKDLKDYVTGFHKRKKKRRKEAEKNQEEAQRRKRLEERKKRRLEREIVLYGGAPTPTDSAPDEGEEYCEDDEEREPVDPIAGTTMYDNGDLKVTVTTSEISREAENLPSEKVTTSEISREAENLPSEKTAAAVPHSIGADKKHHIPVSKCKSFKKVSKQKSRSKPRSKRNKRKGKKKNQTRR